MKNFSDYKYQINKKLKGKIFILTGKNSFYKSGAYKLFENNNIKQEIKLYFKISKNPEVKELKKIIKILYEFKPDIILPIGGGGVIDYAKIANCINNITDLEKKIINSEYKLKRYRKLIAIPTTAGSGAEVTSNAVIYIDKIKFAFEGKELIPDEFILIPNLILNSNFRLKASAGFDAIAQSIESLISRKSNNKSVYNAVKSLNLSMKYYLNYLKNPNIENSYKMLLSANYSGKAISISKTTAPHAISYPFTSHFSIDHGHAVSLTLNKFLKFNYYNLKHSNCDFNLNNRYKIIFKVTNTKNIVELDNFLENLKKKAKLEDNFDKLGINIDKSINKILDGVNILRLSNNPVSLKKKDLVYILKNKI